MASSIVVTSKSAAPSADDVATMTATIFSSKTSQESLDAAYALTDVLLNSVGFRGLEQYGVLKDIKAAANDKKNPGRREGSMFALGALFERFPPKERIAEVVFLCQEGHLVPLALDAMADKASSVREGARYALDALFDNLSPEAKVHGLLPVLHTYLGKRTGKWQGTVAAYELIGRMADKAKMGMASLEEETAKDVLREVMGQRLEDLIPIVESGMHDLKSEVTKQSVKTMNSLTTLLQNDDVAPKIPLLIASMENPSTESLQKAIHALSQTTFVSIVTSPVLALLTPLLERSLNSPNTAQEVLRQTVVVVENLTKLVHDPQEARAFLPRLQPGTQAVRDRASLPEVREIGQRALDVIHKAMGEQADEVATATLSKTTAEEVATALDKQVKANGGLVQYPGDSELWTLAKPYISVIVSEDVNLRKLDRIVDNVAPYLLHLMEDGKASAAADSLHHFYSEEDERKYGVPAKEDDGEVEIVNATFSLGYGGMLLLSHTNLRLLKGHRYGLCGRNGAGKSTLMRSIANGKLEGFPPQDQVRTCFVEHNQGEDADLSILDYVVKDPDLKAEGLDRIVSVLEEVGFTSGPEGRQSEKVGSLSGGWKMKLALARAMLMRADVFLLDEPTNHLDVLNVTWLIEYLTSLTQCTSIIVSHDSDFLNRTVTDILHLDRFKVKRYPGNLQAFVKMVPSAKSYYELSVADDYKFKLPDPPLLEGVKTREKSFLKM